MGECSQIDAPDLFDPVKSRSKLGTPGHVLALIAFDMDDEAVQSIQGR